MKNHKIVFIFIVLLCSCKTVKQDCLSEVKRDYPDLFKNDTIVVLDTFFWAVPDDTFNLIPVNDIAGSDGITWTNDSTALLSWYWNNTKDSVKFVVTKTPIEIHYRDTIFVTKNDSIGYPYFPGGIKYGEDGGVDWFLIIMCVCAVIGMLGFMFKKNN